MAGHLSACGCLFWRLTNPRTNSCLYLALLFPIIRVPLLSGDLTKLLRPVATGSVTNGPGALGLPHTVEQHENIVHSYKELIKRQDAQITDLSSQVKRLHAELDQERLKNSSSDATKVWIFT